MDQDTYTAVFANEYMRAAIWASTTEDGTPLDQTDEVMAFVDAIEALSESARREMITDCEGFVEANWDLLQDVQPEQAGHDFWLTRNRHGAGFWDRGLGQVGDALTANAHAWGNCDLYLQDDGQIGVM